MIRVFSCLQRDQRSGILYYRRVIPERYRPHFGGKYEYKRSLKTHNKKVALPLAMGLYSQLQLKFNEIEQVGYMGKEDKESKFEFGELELPGGGKAKNVVIDTGDPDKDLEALKQLTGGFATANQVKPEVVDVEQPESAKLADVCKEYRQEKLAEGSWRQKTAAEHEATHNLMIQVFKNVEIATVTPAQATSLKKLLRQLPPNHTKGQFAGRTLKQIIAMKPEKTLSVKSLNDNYIQRYSSLFAWAVRQGYCSVNPFEGLKMKQSRAAVSQKDPFSPEDLKALFSPVLFNKDSLGEGWKYYIPLIALYSGCRVQEISQLRAGDVNGEDGIWAFNITDEAGPLKNIGSNRIIPVHPELMEFGFLDLVSAALGEHKNSWKRLFPELYESKRVETGVKKSGDKVSRWFNNTYLKNCGLKPTTRKISFHSFRHTFIDALKKADLPEAKVKQVVGHSHGSITYGRYGSEYSLAELSEVVKTVHFDL